MDQEFGRNNCNSNQFNLSIHLAPNPKLCVVSGALRLILSNIHKQDRKLLSSLCHFVLQNCSLQVTPRDRDCNSNNGHVLSNNVLSEDELNGIVDRLTMNTKYYCNSSEEKSMSNETNQLLREWKVSDVCDMISRKCKLDNDRAAILATIIKNRGINGELLFKYHESKENMMYLFV